MQTITPEHAGLSSERLQRIAPIMQGYVDRNELAGLITVVARRGQIAHQACFGMADLEARRPMRFDTIFRLYSMTKPITAVAVMMLYEEGCFQLHDPISQYIPVFAALKVYAGETPQGMQFAELEREVTIRDLLTHTSGLVYGLEIRPKIRQLENGPANRISLGKAAINNHMEQYLTRQPRRLPSRRGYSSALPLDPTGTPVQMMYAQANLLRWDEPLEEKTGRIAEMPLDHQPGAAWSYSIAYDALGYLVQVVSGMSFEAFLQRRIFQPLGMVDTGFYVPEDKRDRLAGLYVPSERGGLERPDPGIVLARLDGSKPRFISGGGGLMSTAPDYLRFAQMLLNGGELDGVRLLGRKTVALMTQNHLPLALLPLRHGETVFPGMGFGLGFSVVLDLPQYGVLGSVGSYEWHGAAGTLFWIDPQEELVGLLMDQIMPGDSYSVREQFKVLTYQTLVDLSR